MFFSKGGMYTMAPLRFTTEFISFGNEIRFFSFFLGEGGVARKKLKKQEEYDADDAPNWFKEKMFPPTCFQIIEYYAPYSNFNNRKKKIQENPG